MCITGNSTGKDLLTWTAVWCEIKKPCSGSAVASKWLQTDEIACNGSSNCTCAFAIYIAFAIVIVEAISNANAIVKREHLHQYVALL